MKQSTPRGFTLIELLVVIGIIGILAVVAILAINPAEMQRKSRDTNRLSDLTTLRKGIDISISEGKVLVACDDGAGGPKDTTMANIRNASSATNLVCMDISKYLSIIPIDPKNGATITATKGDATTQSVTGKYSFKSDATYYELDSYLESTDNADKVKNDGGNSDDIYEIGTKLTVI